MPPLDLQTLDGRTTRIDADDLEGLAGRLRGQLLTPGAAGYDDARSVWNAMIDRRPALIARCMGAADVMAAVDFARENGALLAVKGVGHNIAGNAVCEGGMMIDLSPMRWARVDPARRRVRVGPGATLGDLDRETQAFGLATPTGINSTTGIAGLTLGGGFGWLTRKHGLTIDNLVSADVITANGALAHADEDENEDLFWGIRGGGGNLGVVTAFEFRLHEVGPEVLSGLVVHPLEAADDVLGFYREFADDMPEEMAAWFVLRQAPPMPFLPPEIHGHGIVILAAIHFGEPADRERDLAPLRAWGDPVADVVAPHRYVDWQAAFDPLLTPGARNYWKSHNFAALEEGAVAEMIEHAGSLPTGQSEILAARLGGAAGRVSPDATAYPHRDAEYVMNVHTRWEDPADDERCVAWAREFFDATLPYATGGSYVNFMSADEGERVPTAAFGRNYARLAEIKATYDPDNMFRMNHNVAPAG